MGRQKLTPEERDEKKRELVRKMRRLIDMVGEVNTLTMDIGMREKINDSISIGVLSLRPASIVDYVQKRFDVVIGQKSRKQNVVFARQVCMHLLKKFTRLSLREIAQYSGTSDHATTLHGLKRLQELMETEEETKIVVEQCEDDILKHFRKSLK